MIGSFKVIINIFQFAHVLIGSKTWYKTCAQLVFGQLLSDYSIISLDILTVIRHNKGLFIYKISKHLIE